MKTLRLRECRLEVKAYLIDHPAAPNPSTHNLADVAPETPIKLQHGRIDLKMGLDLALTVATLHAFNPLQILLIAAHRCIAGYELVG